MPRVKYLVAAKRELAGILRYITTESGSLATAENFVAILRQKCRTLAGLPGHMGRSRSEIGPDIRSYAFRGYVIFFRYVGDDFEVVSILEGHRDMESHFDEPHG